MTISVVIAVYNQEVGLEELNRRLLAVSQHMGNAFQVIYVDDRSNDSSWEVLQELCNEADNTIAIRFTRNFGQLAALSAGMAAATGEFVVLMDCDLQDEPELIPVMLDKLLSSGSNMVCVKRNNRKEAWWKKWLSHQYSLLISWLSGLHFDPEIGTFRIMRRKVLDSYNALSETQVYMTELFLWMGYSTAYVDAEYQKRKYGKSNYNLSKMLKLAFESIVNSSNRLLYVSTYLGFGCFVGSLIVGFYLAFNQVGYSKLDPGTSVIIVFLSLMGGILFLSMGILSIYVAQMYRELKRRPLFIVDEFVNKP